MSLRPLFAGSNQICCLKIKVACKVAKSFFTLFPVALVKVEVQESNIHQINHLKAYLMTCFLQNVHKVTMVGCTDQNICPETYGGPCTYF